MVDTGPEPTYEKNIRVPPPPPAQNINRNKTSGRQLKQSSQLPLPRQDDCKN